MHRRYLIVVAVTMIFFSAGAYAQSGAPAFIAADVHGSFHTATPTMRGGLLPGGRFEVHNATMVDLIRIAYGADTDKIIGGPAWVEWNRYEILAKAPAGT